MRSRHKPQLSNFSDFCPHLRRISLQCFFVPVVQRLPSSYRKGPEGRNLQRFEATDDKRKRGCDQVEEDGRALTCHAHLPGEEPRWRAHARCDAGAVLSARSCSWLLWCARHASLVCLREQTSLNAKEAVARGRVDPMLFGPRSLCPGSVSLKDASQVEVQGL